MSNIYYKRNLPHFQPKDYTFFVTFRTFGLLPTHIIEKLKEGYRFEIKNLTGIKSQGELNAKYSEIKWNYFETFDYRLNNYSRNDFLKNEHAAKLVYDSILFRNKKDYDLVCFTLMPNHVHLIFSPIEQSSKTLSNKNTVLLNGRISDSTYIVTNILQNLKKFTARECNKILNRSGTFWQHESYDHVVKNEIELDKIVQYILYNPVKAKLAENTKDWKWSYYKYW